MKRLIDLKTVRRNPHAGRTLYFETGPVHETIIIKDGIVVSRTQERAVIPVRTMTPAPDWLYSYIDIPVTCRFCGGISLYGDLQSDAYPDGEDGETWDDHVCPKCAAWDCLSEPVVDETLPEAMTRQALG